MASNKTAALALERDFHFTYVNIGGFFMQDEASTDPDSFDYVRFELAVSTLLTVVDNN
jgi:hypothetical protein